MPTDGAKLKERLGRFVTGPDATGYMTAIDRSHPSPIGTWTIDPVDSSVAFAWRKLRLWTITGRRHCLGVIHLDELPPVGVIRFQQPSGLPVLTIALDPASLETHDADLSTMLRGPDVVDVLRHRWWTLHSESLEILPTGAWRVMATLTANGTEGLVELRLEVDPEASGRRGEAIRRGLEDQLGVQVAEVRPFGLSGSAGSTPLRITVKGADGEEPTQLFGKLYAQSHLRADRSYKLVRELLYGQLEDEKPFNTVRRLVQQEDYALRLCRDAGLPTPRPYGVVELTPEREYLLVTEFFADTVELGEAEVDDRVIDDGLSIVRRLWRLGWPTATSSRPTC